MKVQILIDDIELLDSHEEASDMAYKALAVAFCSMDDDHQAKFFQEVGKAFSQWRTYKAGSQIMYIGRHLATCDCIGEEGRAFVRDLAKFMTDFMAPPHLPVIEKEEIPF